MRQLLTPKQVARAIGVSESSLKRWCDRGVLPFVLTPGGHRRIPLNGVMSFLRETRHPLVDPAVLGLPVAVGRGDTTLARAIDRLYEAVVAGDDEIARQVVYDLFLGQHRLAAIGDKVIGPVFQRVGSGWECGEVDVYRERRSCEIVVRILHELRSVIPQAPADAPLAIGATAEHDFSAVGNTLVELVLRELGWNAQSMGSGLPFASIARAAQDMKPRLLWLSVSHIADEEAFVAGYEKLYAAIGEQTAIVVGGRCLTDKLRQRIRFAASGETLQRLEDFAATIYRRPETRPELESRLP